MLTEKIEFIIEQDNGGNGAWYKQRFLFIGRPLKKSLIILEKTRESIDQIINFLIWIFILAGWGSFAFWIFINQRIIAASPIQILFFWRGFNPLILFFLLTLWLDLFLIYRRSQAKAAAKRINYSNFESEKKIFKKSRKKYDVAGAYTSDSWRLIEDAYLLAHKLQKAEVSAIELFRVLLRVKAIQNLLIRLDVDAKKLVDMIDHNLSLEAGKRSGKPLVLSTALQKLIILAFVDAYENKQAGVDYFNLLAFCYQSDPLLAEILYELELDADKIDNAIAWFRINKKLEENYRNYRRLAILKPSNNMNRSYTAVATPTLDHFSHDLTVSAKLGALDVCVYRQKEINSIFESFSGGHNGVLLVGPQGVGKNTIVGGLAQLMVEENVPPFLKDKRLVELDASRLISGADPSQAEERLLSSLNEIARSENIILYINNIENLIGISAGSQESLDLSEVLAEAISRRNLYCLASATSENYAQYIENKAIGNVMTTIGVKEPDINGAIQILESKVGYLESKYKVYIVYSAIEQAVIMSSRYLHEKFLPLKAIDLLEKAAIITAKNLRDNPDKCFCTKEEVASAISESTGIPANKISITEREKLLNLEEEIHKRLVGQEEAVKAVSASLRRARAEMKDSKRPIASFLFLGPTGVGKTELAKSVSEVYFGDENYLVRLDMSEYQSPDSVRKMIGDADGTLGYLTEAVRKKPFSLILLDEIEKANPDILNLFLQLLDDGRLTDGQGRTISFAESIIIATSNIGALYIQEQIKLNTSVNIIKQELIDNQLNKYMRPELINRFDGIIVFRPLSEENIVTIAALMLKKIKKNLADKGIGLKADKDGVSILAHEGYDPKFGARPLRRLLQDRVEDIIANKILAEELKRRDVVIINNRAEIEIEKAPSLIK